MTMSMCVWIFDVCSAVFAFIFTRIVSYFASSSTLGSFIRNILRIIELHCQDSLKYIYNLPKSTFVIFKQNITSDCYVWTCLLCMQALCLLSCRFFSIFVSYEVSNVSTYSCFCIELKTMMVDKKHTVFWHKFFCPRFYMYLAHERHVVWVVIAQNIDLVYLLPGKHYPVKSMYSLS
jgi:hypothetical protein